MGSHLKNKPSRIYFYSRVFYLNRWKITRKYNCQNHIPKCILWFHDIRTCMSSSSIASNRVRRYTSLLHLRCCTCRDILWHHTSATGHSSVERNNKRTSTLETIIIMKIKEKLIIDRTSSLMTHPHLHFKCRSIATVFLPLNSNFPSPLYCDTNTCKTFYDGESSDDF